MLKKNFAIDFFANNIVHIAVHVQKKYTRNVMEGRDKTFPCQERRFADRLRQRYGIQTIWIAKDDDLPFCPDLTPENLDQLGLDTLGVKADEIVLVGENPNAFQDSKLGSYLKTLNKKNIVLTGMNTRYCYKKTLEGGLDAGFDFYAITTLLADTEEENNDLSVMWHRSVLQGLSHQSRKIHFYTENEFIAVLSRNAKRALFPSASGQIATLFKQVSNLTPPERTAPFSEALLLFL